MYILYRYNIGYAIYISIPDRLYDSPFWSSLSNALLHPLHAPDFYYYWCSKGCGPEDYHFYLTGVPVLWVHLYSHWMPLEAL